MDWYYKADPPIVKGRMQQASVAGKLLAMIMPGYGLTVCQGSRCKPG